MEQILFLNACAREDSSRTLWLARQLLDRLEGQLTQLDLYQEPLAPLDRDGLEERSQLLALGDLAAPQFRYARQFAGADTVVIAAPYWDLTFPAVLRLYLEQVSVAGIAFRYTYLGRPIGLCRARRLYYVTTAGGPIGARNLGFQYVQELAGSFFGIPRLTCFSAEKLDMLDADVPAILQQAVAEMEKALPPAVKRPQAP